ncbi:MAG: lysophospholipid acyltransferase family protein [Magnetospirillum sp.]|nr:lysophospholipid acyltransferase family protein [Magnetospirillum sp.]
MGLAKRLGKSDRLRGLLCWLVARYMRLVFLTCRWTTVGADIPARYWQAGEPFIYTFWHGRLLMMALAWRRGVPLEMLISQHRDGQLIARTVAHHGISTVAGSSTRGGAQALRAMLKALREGRSVGITPDGPKGPRMRATAGVVNIARLSGCPVIPATCAFSHRKVLRSWDRFVVPLPFSRGVIAFGAPIFVPKDTGDVGTETYRLLVEETMNRQVDEADRMVGVVPVPPA